MSGTDAQSAIEIEFADAVKTVSAYMRALRVFELGGISTEEHRKRETEALRKAIRQDQNQAIDLPIHPLASDAAALGSKYLHRGRDPKILKTLLEKDCTHPAYREALNIVVLGLGKTQKGIPKRLKKWRTERGQVTGRWTVKSTRDYLIGLAVEAMATGHNVFHRYGDSIGGKLDQDQMQILAEAGKPPEELVIEDILEALNGMAGRPWKKFNNGKGMTESDLLKHKEQSASGEHHVIRPETEVRTSFPNLRLKRGHEAKRKNSICDAVAAALDIEDQTLSVEAIVSAWERYKKQPIL